LFALGMGGVENPLPRMLKALGWRLWTVPFYFRACQPSAVVRTLAAQRAVKLPRLLSVRALGGLAGLLLGAVQLRPRNAGKTPGISWKIIDRFDDCADALWHKSAACYTMMAVRSSEVLNALYPSADPRFLRV